MDTITETEWGKSKVKITPKGRWTFYRTSKKAAALDLALKVSAGAVMYGAGGLLGNAIENIPYVNEAVYNSVDFLSGVDVRNHLGGLIAMLAGVSSFVKSGVKVNPQTVELESIRFTPYFTFEINKQG